MLLNYFKIAFRNIRKQKGYAFLNITGLSIGMMACILILLYVQDELSYDKYHENHERTYRLSRKWFNQNGEVSLHLGHVAPPFGPLIENDFEGEVRHAVRFLGGGGPLIKNGDKGIVEERFFFVDEDVFEVFSWEFIQGDPSTALSEPNALVLTESAAKKYFGNENPEGKTLMFNNYGIELPMKVTGVIKDIPRNSHFGVNMLCSFLSVENFFGRENLMQNWASNNYATYILLEEDYNIERFVAEIPAFIDRHLPNSDDPDASPAHEGTMLEVMPLTDIHLHSHLDSEIEANGDIYYVRLYTAIAIFTLLIACINFMNLSTARSAKRAREVGFRKVMGAMRGGLIKQFIAESTSFALLSLVVALVLVLMLLPFFNDFIGRDLTLNVIQNQFLFFLLFAIVLFVGLVAGSYPAFYLSSFKPVSILKGKLSFGKGNLTFRSSLVVFQFLLSILLIIGVGVVQDQVDYMRSKDLGFNKSDLYVLPSNEEIYNQFESYQSRFIKQPGILDVSLSSRVPSGRLLDAQGGSAEVDGEFQPINVRVADIHIDHGFLSNFGVEFVAGRDFDENIASDSTLAFVLNEAAVNAIGWDSPEEAIDKRFDYGDRQGGVVIGVVKDFHFESLHQSIAPIVFMITQGRARNIVFRINEDRKEETLNYLQEQWAYLMPGFPFEYYTIEDRLSDQYESEDRLSKVIGYFSVLAIVIACLGLFGLSSFTAEQRIKEIGIRKVLGAEILQVLFLLGKGYTLLILLAFGIALLVGWFGASTWLSEFAYSGGLSVSTLVFAGVTSVVIAWLTIGYQTFRAATANPVDAIKHE